MTLGMKGKEEATWDTREVRLKAMRRITSPSTETTRNGAGVVLEKVFPERKHLQEK